MWIIEKSQLNIISYIRITTQMHIILYNIKNVFNLKNTYNIQKFCISLMKEMMFF